MRIQHPLASMYNTEQYINTENQTTRRPNSHHTHRADANEAQHSTAACVSQHTKRDNVSRRACHPRNNTTGTKQHTQAHTGARWMECDTSSERTRRERGASDSCTPHARGRHRVCSIMSCATRRRLTTSCGMT